VNTAKQEGVRALLHGEPRPLVTEEEDMGTLLIVLLVLFVLGGGGWGYRRYRS
jgi:hypothetical protein